MKTQLDGLKTGWKLSWVVVEHLGVGLKIQQLLTLILDMVGISMEYLCNIYGISMEYLWFLGISMEFLWNIYGIYMVSGNIYGISIEYMGEL